MWFRLLPAIGCARRVPRPVGDVGRPPTTTVPRLTGAIVETSPLLYWVVDAESRIIYANAASEQLLGYDPTRSWAWPPATSSTPTTWTPPWPRWAQIVETGSATGPVTSRRWPCGCATATARSTYLDVGAVDELDNPDVDGHHHPGSADERPAAARPGPRVARGLQPAGGRADLPRGRRWPPTCPGRGWPSPTTGTATASPNVVGATLDRGRRGARPTPTPGRTALPWTAGPRRACHGDPPRPRRLPAPSGPRPKRRPAGVLGQPGDRAARRRPAGLRRGVARRWRARPGSASRSRSSGPPS